MLKWQGLYFCVYLVAFLILLQERGVYLFVFKFGLCVFFSLFLSSFVYLGGVLCLFVCLLLFRSVLSMCEVCPIFEEVKISASRAVAAFLRWILIWKATNAALKTDELLQPCCD